MEPVAGAAEVLAEHEASGRHLDVDGVRTFVRDTGEGDPVVLLHGVPASSFLYRKVSTELALRGHRAVAFDLPGFGLADRPTYFDYTMPGLGAWCAEAVRALELPSFHLVVHDAGGPVGFELALLAPERIRSLTVLNTAFSLSSLPYPGELYARAATRVIGPLARADTWRFMMRRVGVADASAVSDAELDVYRLLGLREDDGAAYLRLMKTLRDGHGGGDRYAPVLDSRRTPYPVSALWGALDPLLPLKKQGLAILAATGLDSLQVVPAKHFLQEDQAPVVAATIAATAARA